MPSFVQTVEAGRVASDSVQSSCYLRGPRACRPCLAACRANIAGGTEIGGRSVGSAGVVNDAATLTGLDAAVVGALVEGGAVARGGRYFTSSSRYRPRPRNSAPARAKRACCGQLRTRALYPKGMQARLLRWWMRQRGRPGARVGRFGRIAFAFGPEEATPVERIEAH